MARLEFAENRAREDGERDRRTHCSRQPDQSDYAGYRSDHQVNARFKRRKTRENTRP